MKLTTRDQRRQLAALNRPGLEIFQIAALENLFAAILPKNNFYHGKYANLPLPPRSLAELAKLPFTYKEELLSPHGADDLCRNQTYPTSAYVRFHQTSGTRGRPMAVLDTAEDWHWWLECWQYVLDAADVEPDDRVFMAFSFGPFVGFWSAHDAVVARGCLVVPAGGMSTVGRLELIRHVRATTLCCTPSYALHMAEVGAAHQIDVASLAVAKIILAGEPGGSIPATRARIEAAWQASVLDHAGASEVGPWGFGDPRGRGLYVNEAHFIPEFLSVAHGAPAQDGELSELVLTCLGRRGCPILRYRTGDLVRPRWHANGETRFVFLEGGILGRADDMLIVRGVNIFPSAIEHIVRSFPEVIEYQATVRKQGALDELCVEIEDRLNQPQRVAEELRTRLGLKVEVSTVSVGSLPRFEGKGRRFHDQRGAPAGSAST